MSLKYLYDKLEKMDDKERYAYIKNAFSLFQIRPKFDIDLLFKDSVGKQTSGKNPLGYIVMHLTPVQLTKLVPRYFRQLLNVDCFSDPNDQKIINVIEDTMDAIRSGKYFPTSDLDYTETDMLSVFQFGVGKYSPWSFLKLNPYTLVPALFRHLYKYYYVSKVDEETGVSHLAHAACNIRMMELIKHGRA